MFTLGNETSRLVVSCTVEVGVLSNFYAAGRRGGSLVGTQTLGELRLTQLAVVVFGRVADIC